MSKEPLLKELRSLSEEERWDLLGEALENPLRPVEDIRETPEFIAELKRRMAQSIRRKFLFSPSMTAAMIRVGG